MGKRILHICLCGSVTDGWNYQENELSKWHKKLGYDVKLISSRYEMNSNGKEVISLNQRYTNDDGVERVRLKMRLFEHPKRRLQVYRGLYKEIENYKPDIVFIHSVSFLDINTVVKYLKKHPEIEAYADSHADYANSGRGMLSRLFLHGVIWKHYANKLAKYVEVIYGVLPNRVDFLLDIYKIHPDKTRLLLMGADDDEVSRVEKEGERERIRAKYDINDKVFLIVTGGKFSRSKSEVMDLMKAVSKIQGAKLLMFGPIESSLENRFAEVIDETGTIYEAWVSPKETYSYFAAADLVVFPSTHSVFWEQVAGLGIPMLVRRIEGADHVNLGGNVGFIEHPTAEEMEKSIMELLDKNGQKYNKMLKCAKELGKETFSYRNIAMKSVKSENE